MKCSLQQELADFLVRIRLRQVRGAPEILAENAEGVVTAIDLVIRDLGNHVADARGHVTPHGRVVRFLLLASHQVQVMLHHGLAAEGHHDEHHGNEEVFLLPGEREPHATVAEQVEDVCLSRI